MGVKSTREMSRRALEELYVEKTLRLTEDDLKRKFRAQAVVMKDRDLEDAVERLSDELSGGEGFENYSIISEN